MVSNLPLSRRLARTDMPIMMNMSSLAQRPGTSSMAQGSVYWTGPQGAWERFCGKYFEPTSASSVQPLFRYCVHDFGLPQLREMLVDKCQRVNGLVDRDVVVTPGANDGFYHLVLALCDPGDTVVMFRPYFFNHLMALQMSNINVEFMDCEIANGWLPTEADLELLAERLSMSSNFIGKVKMVVLCNPSNPTGALWPQEYVDRLSNLCAENGVWLVSDEAYDYFTFDNTRHYSPKGSHVINLYSFSKSYGMAGWRVGYIAFDKHNTVLRDHLAKAQDTIPISCSVPSQYMAIEALLESEDGQWVKDRVATLERNREIVWEGVRQVYAHALNDGIVAYTRAAIYFFLPLFADMGIVAAMTDEQELQICEWMALKHKVLVVPGQCFGKTGYFRVTYSNVLEEQCRESTKKLVNALTDLHSIGIDAACAERAYLQ